VGRRRACWAGSGAVISRTARCLSKGRNKTLKDRQGRAANDRHGPQGENRNCTGKSEKKGGGGFINESSAHHRTGLGKATEQQERLSSGKHEVKFKNKRDFNPESLKRIRDMDDQDEGSSQFYKGKKLEGP